MTSDSAPATLPPELERQIFKTTAVLHEKMIPTLLLVARRVHEWVEPHLYSFIQISHTPIKNGHLTRLVHWLDHRPSHFFRRACRHLVLMDMGLENETGWNSADVDRLLLTCTGVTNLLILASNPLRPLVPCVPQLRPTHLILFGQAVPRTTVAESFDFQVPLFQHLTHLQLVGITQKYHVEWPHWPAIAGLSTLTHLAVFAERDVPAYILSILPNLKGFVLYELDNSEMTSPDMLLDPRIFVESAFESVASWYVGARGVDDIWVRADEFIARKRRGEIEKSVYRWPK
ncbi:hypothetical protein FB45DRAFT_1108393 [Roridomyces roridus]|uniref:Uncharacterized protein n=1 Tax=Roridomyces roridus TaxID=1738132 RepID=A0AAD7BBF8_9AGAR|nr:hypothetical protein FB45DRAFT_1108393 [Roridomyces roridus]